jgi:hypothetical protein
MSLTTVADVIFMLSSVLKWIEHEKLIHNRASLLCPFFPLFPVL